MHCQSLQEARKLESVHRVEPSRGCCAGMRHESDCCWHYCSQQKGQHSAGPGTSLQTGSRLEAASTDASAEGFPALCSKIQSLAWSMAVP